MLTAVGMIIAIVALFRMKSKRMERLKEATTEESMQYSSRSPTPCRWRLNFTKYLTPGYTPMTDFHLVIDIDYGAASANGSETQSSNQVSS
ncbi:unnamed protein product [Rotaria magnacalcarata]|uniref:Uncharacterized protein n=1 Tax=Rotaria magnacalcarata TaxID=392030 RepID=A0A816F7R7_9BILA|nr:unnamed protein product [Rotaria magnacalcarata]CAF2033741.1 unnamed protein product [Rotaria magnacalcarata]CAF2177139.1 unnamed protein product [Rotaria magnacalcarata]CAF2231598.1 unnamed protein product [Rotaria magnacalcarata]CAF3985924.1 unnamed protein product [Rotaria magnacalcarata]